MIANKYINFNTMIKKRYYTTTNKKKKIKTSIAPIQFSLGVINNSNYKALIKPFQNASKFKQARWYLVGVFYLITPLTKKSYELKCYKILINPTWIHSYELTNILNYIGSFFTNSSYHWVD